MFGIEVRSLEVDFGIGDRVQVSGTSMDGSVGVVQNINLDERTVDLAISMFGRETQVTLPIGNVVRADL